MATAGNKAAYTSNSGLAGDSVQSGLQAIADQLGAEVGNYNVSIGQYKGDWRVSSSGRSGKLKGKYSDVTDFGENGAEDAVKFAIADAISDGALLGLRSSTQHIIQAGKDVERQLAKAVQFEGVFSELKSMTDPVGFAIEQLDKEFAQLRKTFAEAGASAEEYAQLQQLYDLKRVEALKDANSEAEGLLRDRRTLEARIMELQGNTLGSIAAMRQLELEQMEASLRPLQEQVWALEDAKDAADAAKQLRDAWASVGNGIMDEVNRIRGLTDGSATGGFAALMGQFNAATAAARAGDQTAAGKLAGLSQSLIEAAEGSATSRQELDRVRAQTAASLEQTNRIIMALGGVSALAKGDGSIKEGGPASALLTAAATNQAASAPQSSDKESETQALRDEIAQLRRELMSALAQVASNTGKTARILDDVTADSGGQAISVGQAA